MSDKTVPKYSVLHNIWQTLDKGLMETTIHSNTAVNPALRILGLESTDLSWSPNFWNTELGLESHLLITKTYHREFKTL